MLIWKWCSCTYASYDGIKIYIWMKLKKYHQFYIFIDTRIGHVKYKTLKDIPTIINI